MFYLMKHSNVYAKTVNTTLFRPKYLASIYMFGNDDARIPPKAKGRYTPVDDVGCLQIFH